MNPYDFYITPEEYSAAERIGVSRKTLTRRVRDMAWPKHKAINTPPRPTVDRSRWSGIAKQNGIDYALFHQRIRKGWTEERAAIEPRASEEKIRDNALRATEYGRKYPKSMVKLAEINGIPYKTFCWRVTQGWGFDRAATEPLVSNQERGRRGRMRTIELHGDLNKLVFQKRG